MNIDNEHGHQLPQNDASWSTICFGDGKFVVVSGSGSKAAYSSDRINWTETTMIEGKSWIKSCYGNGKFVVISEEETFAAYSEDGINWNKADLPSGATWISVCYGAGKFVAISATNGIAAYSTDGISWHQTTLPSDMPWFSVCFGNGRFVAVQKASESSEPEPESNALHGDRIIAYSTDGVTWTSEALLPAIENISGESSIESVKSALHYTPEEIGAESKGMAMRYAEDIVNHLEYYCAKKTEVSDAVKSHNLAEDAHAAKFAKKGDMFASVYDPKGKAQDVFQYADAKASAAQSAAATYTDNKIKAIPTPDVSGQIETHNTSENAHADQFAKYLPLNGGKMTGVITGIATPTAKDSPTPKSYVDTALLTTTPNACKVTLTATNWDTNANTQTATVARVLADESRQLILPMPAGVSMNAYVDAGIQMIGQGDGTVTFMADVIPTTDISVWVVVQNVNDVTPLPPLNETSWEIISRQSLLGNAKNHWAVGDCKAIKLSGTVSSLKLDTTLFVYILDFDHDQSSADGERDGITFGTFKTAATNGVDVCLVSGYDENKDFGMGGGAGGWQRSIMRRSTLGSTTTDDGDAPPTTAIYPRANSLLSCFPEDLRNVMRPMYVYSNNRCDITEEICVTGTLDYLPLLAEYEIHGNKYYADRAESEKQAQYAYFKNGNSKKKKRHDAITSSVSWWCRSAKELNPTDTSINNYFCRVLTGGGADIAPAGNSCGVAPIFKV